MTHRIEYLGNLSRRCYLACSGGPDSMAILDFLRKGNREVTVLHFNHGTEHGNQADEFLTDFCGRNNIPIIQVI